MNTQLIQANVNKRLRYQFHANRQARARRRAEAFHNHTITRWAVQMLDFNLTAKNLQPEARARLLDLRDNAQAALDMAAGEWEELRQS